MTSDELDPIRAIGSADIDPLGRVRAAQRAQQAIAAAEVSEVALPPPITSNEAPRAVAPTAPPGTPVEAPSTNGMSDALLRAEAFGEDASAATLGVAHEADAREIVHDAAMHGDELALAIQYQGAQNVAASGAGVLRRTQPSSSEEELDPHKVQAVSGSPRDQREGDDADEDPRRLQQLNDLLGQEVEEQRLADWRARNG